MIKIFYSHTNLSFIGIFIQSANASFRLRSSRTCVLYLVYSAAC